MFPFLSKPNVNLTLATDSSFKSASTTKFCPILQTLTEYGSSSTFKLICFDMSSFISISTCPSSSDFMISCGSLAFDKANLDANAHASYKFPQHSNNF